MKTILITLLLPVFSFAGTFEIIGPCSSEPIFQTEVRSMKDKNVGEFTVKTLTDNKIPFIGNEIGMHSIFDTPTGEEALEILSKSEMRAFGWCYSVDGVEPGVYPSEVILTSDDSHVTWFFGFAHYLEGEWITQCSKSYSVKPKFLCEDKQPLK